MYTAIILSVVLIGVAVLCFRKAGHDPASVGWTFLCFMSATMSLFSPLWAVMFSQPSVPTVLEQHIIRTEVIALRDNSVIRGSVSGGVFFVSGNVSSIPVYSFYKRYGAGCRLGSVDARNAVVYEDTQLGTGYVLEMVTTARVEDSLAETYKGWVWYVYDRGVVKREYELHCPPGSVISSFVLDAQ